MTIVRLLFFQVHIVTPRFHCPFIQSACVNCIVKMRKTEYILVSKFHHVTDCGSSEANAWNHQCHLHWENVWNWERCYWSWSSVICELIKGMQWVSYLRLAYVNYLPFPQKPAFTRRSGSLIVCQQRTHLANSLDSQFAYIKLSLWFVVHLGPSDIC